MNRSYTKKIGPTDQACIIHVHSSIQSSLPPATIYEDTRLSQDSEESVRAIDCILGCVEERVSLRSNLPPTMARNLKGTILKEPMYDFLHDTCRVVFSGSKFDIRQELAAPPKMV